MNSNTNGVSHDNANGDGHGPVPVPANGLANGHANGNGNVNGNGHVSGNGLDHYPSPEPVPVAICGMAMRLPGGIRDDKALYDFLVNKRDARSETPSDRYNAEAYYSPYGKQGTVITKHGYFLSGVDLAQFDHSMFTVAAAEAELMDPCQRLTLEVVREALERAGEDWRGKAIGTYVGMFTEDWQEIHHKESDFFHPYLMMGTLDFALANRISYEYDLRGPRFVSDIPEILSLRRMSEIDKDGHAVLCTRQPARRPESVFTRRWRRSVWGLSPRLS